MPQPTVQEKQTPQADAKPKTVSVELAEAIVSKLDAVIRYENRDALQFMGAVKLETFVNGKRVTMLENLIGSKYDTIKSYLEKKEEQQRDNLFKSLIKNGVGVLEAHKIAYNDAKLAEPATAPLTTPATPAGK